MNILFAQAGKPRKEMLTDMGTDRRRACLCIPGEGTAKPMILY